MLQIKNQDNIPSVNFNLVVHNPNDWGLRVADIQSDLFINENLIGIGSLDHPIHVPLRAEAALPLTVLTKQNELVKLLPAGISVLFGNQSIAARVKGSITLRKFIFRKKIPFELKQNITAESLKGIF